MLTYQNFHDIDPAQLLALYQDAGWLAYTRDPEALHRAVANSWRVISAWEGEHLVGLVRSVGDGVSVALIQDILVLKSRQNLGVGSVLLARMLQEIGPIRQVVLQTDRGTDNQATVEWYRKRGFKELAEWDCVGLAIFQGSVDGR